MNPSTKIRDTVPLLKKKGENLIVDETEKRWQRILSLLDDVSKETEEESDEEKDNQETAETGAMIINSEKSEATLSKVFSFLKKQALDRTKTFWYTVKTPSPTTSEEIECAQSSFRTVESFRINSKHIKFSLTILTNLNAVFLKLIDYLKAFMTKLNAEPENVETDTKSNTRSSSNWRGFPEAMYRSKSENLCGTNSSGFLIHQTNNLFNIPAALSEFPLKGRESSNRNALQVLKQRIRKQRLLIEYLGNFPAFPDIQFIKNKIARKLGKLEKVVSLLEQKL